MFEEVLPKDTKKLFAKLKLIKQIDKFYLSGGTGLALQLGHRESEDLDFFSRKLFDPEKLVISLKQLGKLQGVEIGTGTLNLFVSGVQLQWLHYPYDLIEPVVSYNGIKLASSLDIACNKLITVGSRGSKKDFVDVYFLLKQFSLEQMFKAMKKKYVGLDYSQPHILKALVWFDEAESQPMPRMHQKADWEMVKQRMVKAVKEYKF